MLHSQTHTKQPNKPIITGAGTHRAPYREDEQLAGIAGNRSGYVMPAADACRQGTTLAGTAAAPLLVLLPVPLLVLLLVVLLVRLVVFTQRSAATAR
jgi:hypothetical protein